MTKYKLCDNEFNVKGKLEIHQGKVREISFGPKDNELNKKFRKLVQKFVDDNGLKITSTYFSNTHHNRLHQKTKCKRWKIFTIKKVGTSIKKKKYLSLEREE